LDDRDIRAQRWHVKVLYLDHPEGDFLSAIVYTGLCQELGPENVVDHPYKLSYHGEIHRYPTPYEFEPPDKIGVTAPFSWMVAQPGREWTRDEILSRLAEFSLVLLASPRRYNVAALHEIIAAVGRDRLPPIAIMDGEDYTHIRTDLVEQFHPRVYFKRELLPNSYAGCRLEPFSFASPVMAVEPVEKDIDVLFIGGNTWAARGEACAALESAFGDRFVGGIQAHVPHDQYLRTLARARVAVSVRGFGYDTLRVWEIPICPGTLLVADRLPILRPFPLVDREHALYFTSPQELVEAVQRALEDEPWRARIAKAGNEHVQKFHTAQARARLLLDIAKGS
jgi:hypothetical protein